MDKITHQVRCEQWTSIINECLASGMNKTAWCRENGISEKQFFYWQRILRKLDLFPILSDRYDTKRKSNLKCPMKKDEEKGGFLVEAEFWTKEKSPTHQAFLRCCPKTSTAIHSYTIPYRTKICKSFRNCSKNFVKC